MPVPACNSRRLINLRAFAHHQLQGIGNVLRFNWKICVLSLLQVRGRKLLAPPQQDIAERFNTSYGKCAWPAGFAGNELVESSSASHCRV